MKITLKFSAYLPPTNNNSFTWTPSSPYAPHKLHPVSLLKFEGARQCRTPHLAPWEYSFLTTAHEHIPGTSSLLAARKPYLLETHPQPLGLTVIPTLKITPTSPALAPTEYHSDKPNIWLFCYEKLQLCNDTSCIQLTAIESLLIKTLTQTDDRICSKQELIIGINKDTYSYSGLEMCLSRLQNKFKNVFGERLFRSVRNRGYCLVQDVRPSES